MCRFVCQPLQPLQPLQLQVRPPALYAVSAALLMLGEVAEPPKAWRSLGPRLGKKDARGNRLPWRRRLIKRMAAFDPLGMSEVRVERVQVLRRVGFVPEEVRIDAARRRCLRPGGEDPPARGNGVLAAVRREGDVMAAVVRGGGGMRRRRARLCALQPRARRRRRAVLDPGAWAQQAAAGRLEPRTRVLLLDRREHDVVPGHAGLVRSCEVHAALRRAFNWVAGTQMKRPTLRTRQHGALCEGGRRGH